MRFLSQLQSCRRGGVVHVDECDTDVVRKHVCNSHKNVRSHLNYVTDYCL